jgi:hypothetical protein
MITSDVYCNREVSKTSNRKKVMQREEMGPSAQGMQQVLIDHLKSRDNMKTNVKNENWVNI